MNEPEYSPVITWEETKYELCLNLMTGKFCWLEVGTGNFGGEWFDSKDDAQKRIPF
jgi:hypothetical protein